VIQNPDYVSNKTHALKHLGLKASIEDKRYKKAEIRYPYYVLSLI
jgi:hypothetical protein